MTISRDYTKLKTAFNRAEQSKAITLQINSHFPTALRYLASHQLLPLPPAPPFRPPTYATLTASDV